jgi:membrane-associated phospholipid phosphatase
MASISARSLQPVPIRKGHHRIPHAAFIAGEGILLLIILALSILVKRHPGPVPGDLGLELDVQHWLLPHKALTSAVEAVSTFNWPVPAAATLAAVFVIFLVLRRWLDAIIMVITAAVTDESSFLLNQFIHRPRPSGHHLFLLGTIKNTYSFPSGHVIHATAIFGLFLFLSTQIRRPIHPALIWMIRIVLIAAIVLMPISRMLEGEHWPTDVLAGLLYGAFYLILAAHVYLWARNRWPRLLAADER